MNKERGMTFLELMVATSILIVGISGVIGFLGKTFYSASMASNQLKAAYLAQEGVELVRNIRDSNWVKDVNWLNNINTNCSCCEIAYDHNSSTGMTLCSGGEPRPLKLYQGFYGYSANPSAEESNFSRKIETSLKGDYLQVETTVYWKERGTTHSVAVVENFYNWR